MRELYAAAISGAESGSFYYLESKCYNCGKEIDEVKDLHVNYFGKLSCMDKDCLAGAFKVEEDKEKN